MGEMRNKQLSITGSCLLSPHLALYLLMKQIILNQTCRQYLLVIVENEQLNPPTRKLISVDLEHQ